MIDADREGLDQRVLILAPTGKDGMLTQEILDKAGFATLACRDAVSMCREVEQGASSLLVAEEAITPEGARALTDLRAREPAWSDLPILVVKRPGTDSATVTAALDSLGNVTLLERPVRVSTLVSSVRVAARARERQYALRDRFEAQTLMAAIVASSDDAVISKTLEGIILTWNEGAERIFGYSAAEAIGRPVTLIIPPDRHDEERMILDRLARGEHIQHFETVRVSKNGKPIDISLSISPVRDATNRIIGVSTVARDITERKEAQAALLAKERQLQHISDNAAVLVTQCNRDLRYVFVNRAAAEYLGRPIEEIIDKPIAEVMSAQAVETIRPYVERVLMGERVEYEAEIPYAHAGLRWMRVVYVPDYDTQGNICGWIAAATDITDRKRAEEALREHIEAIKRAELALREADRRKDEFLATLAHELRNPLAPIRNSLDILRLSANLDPAVERVIEMMERQVSHMVRLVDDLMEVSRITRGKIELRKERIELAGVIRSAVETSQPLITSGGHRLSITIPPEPMTLDADAIRLAQVFANLLNNAAKYSDKPGQISVTVRREAATAIVSVRDTGVGVPAEMLPRIFDMFTQVDGTHPGSRGGLGIGLTLVRSLVQMHGGHVTVSSEGPGKGSEFVVHLPLAEGVPVDRALPRSTQSGVIPLRVLVVDDNRDAADSLGDLLRRLATEVQVVHSGPAALKTMETFHPSLVFLDIGMPGMDGYEVARRIREQPQNRDLMLVALTGWGQEEDRRRSRTAGFDFHLTKPTDLSALQDLVVSVKERQERRPTEPCA